MIVQSAIKHSGTIYVGRRHCDIIRTMVHECGIQPPIGPSNSVQGFVDEDGAFLDRIEAATHALACGQIDKLRWPPNLFSEDLY